MLHNPLNSFQRFRQFLLLGTERDADVPLSVRSEDESRSDEYAGFVEHPFGQFLYIVVRVGDTSPEEHTIF